MLNSSDNNQNFFLSTLNQANNNNSNIISGKSDTELINLLLESQNELNKLRLRMDILQIMKEKDVIEVEPSCDNDNGRNEHVSFESIIEELDILKASVSAKATNENILGDKYI